VPISRTNRKGKTYHLHRGATKTGKPRWYFSLSAEGELVDAVPEGYEIYENPGAQVFLRRIVPKLITPEEQSLVESGLRRLAGMNHAIVEIAGDVLTIFVEQHETDSGRKEWEETVRLLASPFLLSRGRRYEVRPERFRYEPMMRFILADTKKRLFEPERWCYRGAIDGWISIFRPAKLDRLIAELLPRLGTQEYFEL